MSNIAIERPIKMQWYSWPDVVPDILTIGKPMGNGHPVAAVITTPQVAASFAATGMEYFNTVSTSVTPVDKIIGLSLIYAAQYDNRLSK